MVDLKRNAGKAFNDVEVVLQKCCKMLSIICSCPSMCCWSTDGVCFGTKASEVKEVEQESPPLEDAD
jgi:hypothetical protein|eukprot:scaffold15773_cov193-Alexandrium_tamarense.AAC.10